MPNLRKKAFINDRSHHDCERCIHCTSGWGDLAKCELTEWEYCTSHMKPYFRERNKSAASDILSIPLNQCVSLGDLMGHIEECKSLDRQDSVTSETFIKEDEMKL